MTRVLVIDDEHVIRDLLIEFLDDAGYEAIGADTASRAIELLEENDISLVVSDILMPGMSGIELLEEVHARRPSVPVILITAAGTYENLSAALARGAAGLVLKPFSQMDLLDAVRGVMARAEKSEHELRERLLTPMLAVALADAIEARDPSTRGHCDRLSQLAVRIGIHLELEGNDLEIVRLGSILHDVGKIGIPDRVLLKRGQLTTEERALMFTHTLIGDSLLEPLDLLGKVRLVVRHHHERWDGEGYPDGLVGEAIPLAARLVAVADVVEAMSAHRPYRKPLTHAGIMRELTQGRGQQWDPRIVDVVLDMIRFGELRFGSDGLVLMEVSDGEKRKASFTVLLVEDDPAQAALAVTTLEGALENVRIIHAADVASAIELARGSTWSLAVLDHHLPDGTGLELLDVFRAFAPGMPVVMMTGEGSEGLAIEAFRRGAADYVVKGRDCMEELTYRVRALLELAA